MLQDDSNAETPSDAGPPADDAAMSRKSRMRPKSRDEGVAAERRPGLQGDAGPDKLKQDTPGRPKSASSRQQTQPRQTVQSGSDEDDSAPRSK
jgi:hypothetical protein